MRLVITELSQALAELNEVLAELSWIVTELSHKLSKLSYQLSSDHLLEFQVFYLGLSYELSTQFYKLYFYWTLNF